MVYRESEENEEDYEVLIDGVWVHECHLDHLYSSVFNTNAYNT